MSFVTAYRCDYCFQIKLDTEIVGIIPTEDLFDRLRSYPTTSKSHKTQIHYCLECYKHNVLNMVEKFVTRKKNEIEYKAKVLEFSYSLRAKCVSNVRNSVFKAET